MTREILYSPGFGAGWTTWNEGETARIMLTYQPIIDFIKSGGKFTTSDCHQSLKKDKLHPLLEEMIEHIRTVIGDSEACVCVLGADDLRVATVDGPVRIHDYDGNESYEVQGDFEGWM